MNFKFPKIFLFLLLIGVSKTIYAQWVIIDTIANQFSPFFLVDYHVRFINDSNYIYYYTWDPPTPSTPADLHIFKTNNDGLSWSSIFYGGGYGQSIYDVIFPTTDTGYFISGNYYEPKLRKTIDGGDTWEIFSLSNPVNLFFIKPDKGFGISGITTYIYENDSLKVIGNIQNYNIINPKLFFTSDITGYCYFYDNNISGINSNRNTLIKTVDGGQNWSHIWQDTINFIYDLYFPSDSVGFIISDSGKIAKTTDGGNNWQIINTGANYLNSLYFVNETNGYAVGSGIFYTSNGGVSWQQQSMPQVYHPSYIKMINDTIGYIKALMSNGGYLYNIILKTTNGGIQHTNESIKNHTFTLFPNPAKDVIFIEPYIYIQSIKIYNTLGQLIKTQTAGCDEGIFVGELLNGIYFVEIYAHENIEIRKFLKE